MDAEALVCVVEDDAPLRASLQDLLQSVGLRVMAFASAHAFLDHPPPEGPGCLVLDVRLPGLSGLELQQRLAEVDRDLPIIFLTGHGDIPMTVQRAARQGPSSVSHQARPRSRRCSTPSMQALARDLPGVANSAPSARPCCRCGHALDVLTPREREVMARVVAGAPQQADRRRCWARAEATVKVHRSARHGTRWPPSPSRPSSAWRIASACPPHPRSRLYQSLITFTKVY